MPSDNPFIPRRSFLFFGSRQKEEWQKTELFHLESKLRQAEDGLSHMSSFQTTLTSQLDAFSRLRLSQEEWESRLDSSHAKLTQNYEFLMLLEQGHCELRQEWSHYRNQYDELCTALEEMETELKSFQT